MPRGRPAKKSVHTIFEQFVAVGGEFDVWDARALSSRRGCAGETQERNSKYCVES